MLVHPSPYLFNQDGTAAAHRPRIGDAPAQIAYGQDFQIATADAVAQVTLVGPNGAPSVSRIVHVG